MKKRKSVEEHIYEALGIKQFKKLVIWLQGIIRIPLKKKGLLNENNKSVEGFDNYFLNDYSIKGLKKFIIQGILINTLIHGPLLISTLIKMGIAINEGTDFLTLLGSVSFPILINGYCIMLQRYNAIRINRTIKLLEKKEQIKKEREYNLELERLKELSRVRQEKNRVVVCMEQQRKESVQSIIPSFSSGYTNCIIEETEKNSDNSEILLQRIRK